jgi:hypothetical protein
VGDPLILARECLAIARLGPPGALGQLERRLGNLVAALETVELEVSSDGSSYLVPRYEPEIIRYEPEPEPAQSARPRSTAPCPTPGWKLGAVGGGHE